MTRIMIKGRTIHLLAWLAVLAQLWVVVPSAMALDMQLHPSAGMMNHAAMAVSRATVQDMADAGEMRMNCCQSQSDCNCNQGSCMIHPVLVTAREPQHPLVSEPKPLSEPAFSLSLLPRSLYRPPIG